ncbi:MAG: M1 family metallopeptidase [Bacteroidetes bacterium]|nr:M1 family metallopeptidase [Bacteroidota bacterium]MBM3424346.1 M1 family metallopeptidase [Bacteroidota bacterium]
MKRLILFLGLILSQFSIVAQYWQQRVDYRIDVTLDDQTHRLYANLAFDYTNNSPHTLDSLYLHVWPNAYKDRTTALAQQLNGQGTKISTMDTSDLGDITRLDFKINGKPVSWSYNPKNIDIVGIKLNESLNPGKSLTLTTPFTVKIPSGSISRLGHIGQSYQITQWYPKPAVFDRKGWHAMPYLNQGEFYSEFGSFDVSITVPKNYVLGATGERQSVEEAAFMDSLAAHTQTNLTSIIALPSGALRDSFPASSKEWKTVRFTQDNVHDFAWFTDKRYKVLKGSVKLPHSGRTVTSWALFTPANALLWKNSIEYLNDGTYYYSQWNGDYPYTAVTAVDGTISAGGGMEYPMITVIGNSSTARDLEVVIVHEVGHNWFYGILGSNEREHGWMDEGINTANEMRYVATKYPNNNYLSDIVAGGRLHLNDLSHHDLGDIMYRFLAVISADQPIQTHSASFSAANYGAIMYQKTGLVFHYLRSYLGDKLYDQCMQRYYDLYQFKHPYPEDMQEVVESISGRKLDWLFRDLIQTTKVVDYRMVRAKYLSAMNTYSVKVKNKGAIQGPIQVVSLDNSGKVLESQWTDPKKKCSTLMFQGGEEIALFAIDPTKQIPEINRSNNRINPNKFLFKKCEPLAFEFMIGDHEPSKTHVFWTPMMAFNRSDRFMIGAAFHNFGLPFKPFQFLVVPMYSVGRNTIGGVAELSKMYFPSKDLRSIKAGISVKSFGIQEDPKGQTQSYFVAITPYLNVNLVPNRTPKGFSNDLTFKWLWRRDVMSAYDNSVENGLKVNQTLSWRKKRISHESQLQFEGVLGYSILPLDIASFARISTAQSLTVTYLDRKMNRKMNFRVYGGYNLAYNPGTSTYQSMGRYSISMFGAAGYQDVFAENYYFNRGSLYGAQYANDMGGFRTASDVLKMSNYWASSLNATIQLPVKPNIFVAYADVGIYEDGMRAATIYNAGLGMNLADVIGVYFPLVQSSNMGNLYQNYALSIRLTLRFNPFNAPVKLANLINR